MHKQQIIGIGECMVELSEADDSLLRRSFAGDVFNTLWYARHALSAEWGVRLLSAVGSDPLSDQMLAFIEDGGIDTRLVKRIPDRRPGLYMIHLDGAERSFSYWRDRSAAKLLAADTAHLNNSFDDASVIYFSGITLAILSAEDANGFLACLAAAREAGRTIVFDPNIRPALWDTLVRARETIAQAASISTIVMPSFDDEARTFDDADTDATLSRYASYGSDLIVLKNGAGDVVVRAQGGDTTVFKTAPVTAPVDTTGAGDSFNGAFLAEYVSSGDVAKSVAAGQACAAEVVCHRGALIARSSN